MADKSEQQLREKIVSQKAALAELPSLKSIVVETGLTSSETKARAQQIKELSDNEEELELLLESRRVEAVISLQDELHPPENPEDCPMCLETIKHVNSRTTRRFFCCGGWLCLQCFEEREANFEKERFDKLFSNRCPLCREKFYTNQEAGARVLEHSNKGKAWAQVMIGAWCLDAPHAKKFSLSLDEKESLKLIEQAADQGDPQALYILSGCVDEETSKMQYLKRAADLGYPDAQHELALSCSMKHDKEKYLHYITLAASQGYGISCGFLGYLFLHNECGLTQSFVLTKHYAGKNLERDNMSACNFSTASYFLGNDRYEGIVDIPGHSPIPTFLFWGRRAVEGSLPVKAKDIMIKKMSKVEEQAKSHCANCRKETGCLSFKRCVRCLGAWYCGKECQIQHWKAGHKVDCVKRK